MYEGDYDSMEEDCHCTNITITYNAQITKAFLLSSRTFHLFLCLATSLTPKVVWFEHFGMLLFDIYIGVDCFTPAY